MRAYIVSPKIYSDHKKLHKNFLDAKKKTVYMFRTTNKKEPDQDKQQKLCAANSKTEIAWICEKDDIGNISLTNIARYFQNWHSMDFAKAKGSNRKLMNNVPPFRYMFSNDNLICLPHTQPYSYSYVYVCMYVCRRCCNVFSLVWWHHIGLLGFIFCSDFHIIVHSCSLFSIALYCTTLWYAFQFLCP